MWSYETPRKIKFFFLFWIHLIFNKLKNYKAPPIVVDRDFAAALKRYAQLLARVILGKKTGGLNLSEDIKASFFAY